jgi:hypothetical protein
VSLIFFRREAYQSSVNGSRQAYGAGQGRGRIIRHTPDLSTYFPSFNSVWPWVILWVVKSPLRDRVLDRCVDGASAFNFVRVLPGHRPRAANEPRAVRAANVGRRVESRRATLRFFDGVT